jgi:hypothetical protein
MAAIVHLCQHPDCAEPAEANCECGQWFCSDHGSVGGDRYVEDFGEVAVPNQCWKCGGFDMDGAQ